MRKPKYWPFLAALFAFSLLAAACGDDAETTATEPGAESEETSDEMSDQEMSDDEMSDDEMSDGGHGHGDGLEVPDGMAVPVISVSATEDTKSGHNLFIELEDFTVNPEAASTDAVDGEGHLHLYVNGERQARFYNQALHLTGLPAGEHEVAVEVSANNHSAYTVDGMPIRATTTITVPETEDGGAAHGHDAELFESANPPALEITVTKDPKSGWNVFADVTDLEFAPAAVGSESVDGEGHLHLYVDGEKITRLYGPWWHISALEAGTHEIEIEASANDHSAYGLDGEPIRVGATVEVGEADGMAMTDSDDGHSDDHDEDEDHDKDHDEDEDGHGHGGTGEAMDMPAAEADVVITASLADGDLDVDERRYKVDTGSTVGIVFTSDVEEQVHVHGYDLLATTGPDAPVDLTFLADSPGTFEVELEQSGRFLFEIQVS